MNPAFPLYINLNQESKEYIDFKVQKYVRSLEGAKTVQHVTGWFNHFIPENISLYRVLLPSGATVEKAKEIAINCLKQMMVDFTTKSTNLMISNITPWDLAYWRNETLTRLFGPSTTKLHIKVLTSDGTYDHILSEDFVYGILVGLGNNSNISVYFGTTILKGVNRKYITGNRKKYAAVVNNEWYWFNSLDFIQGINTAAEWTNQDPNYLISKLEEFED